MDEQQLIERMSDLLLKMIKVGSFNRVEDMNEAVHLIALAEGLGAAKEETLQCFQRVAESVIGDT